MAGVGELRLPDVQPLPPGTQMPPSEDVNEFNRSMTGSFDGTMMHTMLPSALWLCYGRPHAPSAPGPWPIICLWLCQSSALLCPSCALLCYDGSFDEMDTMP